MRQLLTAATGAMLLALLLGAPNHASADYIVTKRDSETGDYLQMVFDDEGNGYFSQHWSHGFHSQDIESMKIAGSLDYAATLGAIPIVPAIRYGFTGIYMDSGDFLTGHRLAASVALGWNDRFKSLFSIAPRSTTTRSTASCLPSPHGTA